MAKLTEPIVTVRHAGAPASFTARVGSEFDVILQYVTVDENGDQQGVNLNRYTLRANYEFYDAEFGSDGANEGKVTNIIGRAANIANNQVYPPEAADDIVTADRDQTANPGIYNIHIAPNILPEAMRLVEADASELPTVIVYITFDDGNNDIDQVTVVGGFRRGYGSLAQELAGAQGG